MERIKDIVAAIDAGKPKPIYFLMGDEPYYIDRISQYIAENVLTEDERGFNQMVLYGRDTQVDEIIGNAKRFPDDGRAPGGNCQGSSALIPNH